MSIVLGSLVLGAGCRGSLRYDEGTGAGGAGGLVQYAASGLQIPTASTQFAVDVDGDGVAENQFAKLMSFLLMSLDAQESLDLAVARGEAVLLLGVDSEGPGGGAATVTLNWAGQPAGAPPPSYQGTDRFMSMASVRDLRLSGAIDAGRLRTATVAQAGGAEHVIPFKLRVDRHSGFIPIYGARVGGQLRDDGIIDGLLQGVILKADFDAIIPGVARTITARINAEHDDPNQRDRWRVVITVLESGPVSDAKCRVEADCCGKSPGTCVILADEIRAHPLYQATVSPDVQAFDVQALAEGRRVFAPVPGGAEKNGISFGVGFAAVRATWAGDCSAEGFCQERALPLPVGERVPGRKLFATALDNVWLAGDGGLLLRFDGWDWSLATLPAEMAGVGLRALHGTGPDDMWIGAENGAIARFNGRAMTLVPSEDAGPLRGLFVHGPGRVFAVAGTRLLQLDGGRFVSRHDFGEPVEDIWGAPARDGGPPGDLWVLGRSAWRYDGSNWRSYALNPSSCGSIWGSGPSDVWVGCGIGIVQHFDGTSWSRGNHGVPASAPIRAISGTGPGDVYFSGGASIHYDGQRYRELKSGQARWGGADLVTAAGRGDVWYLTDGITRWLLHYRP